MRLEREDCISRCLCRLALGLAVGHLMESGGKFPAWDFSLALVDSILSHVSVLTGHSGKCAFFAKNPIAPPFQCVLLTCGDQETTLTLHLDVAMTDSL